MSGGLTEDNSWVDPFIDTPVADIVARIKGGLNYSWLPGNTFEYSNLGYTLAGWRWARRSASGSRTGSPRRSSVPWA